MRYGNRNFLPWYLSYLGLPFLGFLQTTQLISSVVIYLANSKKRRLPPLACYWLRPWHVSHNAKLIWFLQRFRRDMLQLDVARRIQNKSVMIKPRWPKHKSFIDPEICHKSQDFFWKFVHFIVFSTTTQRRQVDVFWRRRTLLCSTMVQRWSYQVTMVGSYRGCTIGILRVSWTIATDKYVYSSCEPCSSVYVRWFERRWQINC